MFNMYNIRSTGLLASGERVSPLYVGWASTQSVLDGQQCRLRLSAWCVRVVHVWQNAERARESRWRYDGRDFRDIQSLARPNIDELGAIWARLSALVIWSVPCITLSRTVPLFDWQLLYA